MNKQLENRISSREVAQMMEIEHKNLLKKIDGINKDLTSSKVSPSKYWIEGIYKDSKGEERREFQITKRGCEFLAHKTTGTKGNLFTDRYMDRFEQMKEQIQNPIKSVENMDLANQMMNVMQNTQMIAQVVQGLNQGMNYMQQYVQDSIQAKDNQIDKAMDLIGLRARNVSRLTGKLKEVLLQKHGRTVNASDIKYIKAKDKIFKEFNVFKWEEIPVGKYNTIFAYIEEVV
jgi:phage regulator Rha-like protein